MILGCCISETVNAARLAKRFAETTDVFIRTAFRSLLADGRLHAQFGFSYLESRRGWLDAPRGAHRLGRYLCFALAELERRMGSVPIAAQPLAGAERAIGLPDLTDLSQTFQLTVLNACIVQSNRYSETAPKRRAASGTRELVHDRARHALGRDRHR